MAEELVADRLQSNLTRLRLPRISEILLDIVETAKAQGYSHLQVLDALLEEEVACKEQRRLDTALKVSGLPFIKTLDDFDFTFQPNLDRRQVNALFDLTFLANKENVVLLGPPGVGKTHLAVALAVKASQAGQTIFFTSMADLIDKLKADHGAGKTGRLRGHYKAAVVVVDEVGYTPITQDECNLFYRFVATRYEKASTIITSNKAFVDWQEMFHDAVIVTAILDRLLHYREQYMSNGKKVLKWINGALHYPEPWEAWRMPKDEEISLLNEAVARSLENPEQLTRCPECGQVDLIFFWSVIKGGANGVCVCTASKLRYELRGVKLYTWMTTAERKPKEVFPNVTIWRPSTISFSAEDPSWSIDK